MFINIAVRRVEDVLLSLRLFLFPFTLKNEDGGRDRRAGAGGKEECEQKCFQKETFYLAFFTIFCKTDTYFKWKHKFKKPGNVLGRDKLAPCQVASAGRDPAWQQQHVSSPSHRSPGRQHTPQPGLVCRGKVAQGPLCGSPSSLKHPHIWAINFSQAASHLF